MKKSTICNGKKINIVELISNICIEVRCVRNADLFFAVKWIIHKKINWTNGIVRTKPVHSYGSKKNETKSLLKTSNRFSTESDVLTSQTYCESIESGLNKISRTCLKIKENKNVQWLGYNSNLRRKFLGFWKFEKKISQAGIVFV